MEINTVHAPPILLFQKRRQLAKRIFDISLTVAALPILLPLMGLCALLIWLDDPGTVLFKQCRTGRGGRRFQMYKFRTMLANAEELKWQYAHLNELTWPDFKITDDPRVTRIGHFLRRSSLDELPQIINILKGEMSLVGPRPTSFDVTTYSLWHTERLEVLPGLTGLWQISGRSDVDFDERLRLDVEYIRRQSLWLDLVILLRTFTAVLNRRGAY
jgi:lipopolysaccharide/colanic/teichoic acid biosynthesis glycosyltransferase